MQQAIKANPKARINHLGSTLEEFCAFNPDGKKMVYNWLLHPPENRMAAAGYAIKTPDAINEFTYALKAISGEWEGYLKLLPITRGSIEAKDYNLEV